MSTAIEIRTLHTFADMKNIQQLEKLVWNMDPLPIHQTITATKNGGLILGAFLAEELVGFSYSFAGFNKNQSYLCSHMLGIHPNHQEKGIGAKLKQAQKELAREMGYDLIVWTYDPLETRNGYLNLTKLNAICSTYIENCYGEMEDNLNNGLPSDRFKVEWWINSPHVAEQHSPDTSREQFVFQYEETEDGFPKLKEVEAALETVSDGKPVLVPMPANMQKLKSTNPALALDWRLKTRAIFLELFSNGYTAASMIKSNAGSVHHYILVQRQGLEINTKIKAGNKNEG